MKGFSVFIFGIYLYITAVLYAVVPSVRPGIGAIPYPGGSTFRVWGPHAASMNVAGTFNGWSTTSNPLASEGGGWWSRDVTGAVAGQEYKYVINGAIWKADPRAKGMVNSVGNGIIVDTTYNWTAFTMPAWNDMVIYEMHIGTYNDNPGGSPGTWSTATAKLDHIQSLGVNAVEIMPVAEFPGDYSLGYNPVNIFAPETAYGSLSSMRNFIDQCHQRGIAVILDVVYNHLGPTDLGNSIWQFDGYSYNNLPDRGGIYFYEDDRRYTPWGDTRPNYSTDEVRSFIRDNVMYWLNEYNMDGIRMDGTAYIREIGIGQPDIPEGWSLMQWINNEVDASHPQKIIVAEDMRDNDWITKTTGEGGAGFDSQWDAGFHHKVVPVLTKGLDGERNMWDIRDAIVHVYNGWDTQRVIYTESHDEVGSSSGQSRVPSQINWSDPDSYWSKKRSTLGAGIMFTSPGIPMLFMGQEFLEDGAWNDYDTLDWTKNTTFAGIKLLYQHLIGLRRNLSENTRGLTAKNVNVFHVNNTDKVIAFHRWWNGGPGDDVVVVANFAYQGFTNYNIGMPRAGRWRVRFNSDWNGYDLGFGNWNSYDANAVSGAKDGLPYNANVGVGPYSIIILSQGTSPNLDGTGGVDLNDFSIFESQWQSACDSWDSCQGADFDMSGWVDMTDLYTFISHWLDDIP
jgi:1,4-alpha-glucan branching enzyme